MKLCTILITRNKACHVRALHTMMRLNAVLSSQNHENHIVFVNDDAVTRTNTINEKMKSFDKILFIDYSVCLDYTSIDLVARDLHGVDCLVFPCVTEHINWDRFRSEIKKNAYGEEPISQLALDFDTKVLGKPVFPDIYKVEKTSPRCWVMDCKAVHKCITREMVGGKKKKLNASAGAARHLPVGAESMFDFMLEKGVRVCAFTAADITIIYTHECIGNIPNMNGARMMSGGDAAAA